MTLLSLFVERRGPKVEATPEIKTISMEEADDFTDVPLPGEEAAAKEMEEEEAPPTQPVPKPEPVTVVAPAKKATQPTLAQMLSGKRKADAPPAAPPTPDKKAKTEEKPKKPAGGEVAKKMRTKLIKLEDENEEKEVKSDVKELTAEEELKALKAANARLLKEKAEKEAADKKIAALGKKTKKRQAEKKAKKKGGSEYIDDEAAEGKADDEETEDDEEKMEQKKDDDFIAPEDDGTKVKADGENENEDEGEDVEEVSEEQAEDEAVENAIKEKAKRSSAKPKMCLECNTEIDSGWRQDRVGTSKKWGYYHDGKCWKDYQMRELNKPEGGEEEKKGKGKGKPKADAKPKPPTKLQLKAKMRSSWDKYKNQFPDVMKECFKDVLAADKEQFKGVIDFVDAFISDGAVWAAWLEKRKKNPKVAIPKNLKMSTTEAFTSALPMFYALSNPEGHKSMTTLIEKIHA